MATTDVSGNVSVTYTASGAAVVCDVRATQALTVQTSKAVDMTRS
jgi:hypothetical protein